MSKFLFVLAWVESKSNDYLEATVNELNDGFLVQIKTLGYLYDGFSVSCKTDLERNRILMEWKKPVNIAGNVWKSLLNEAKKELEKQLGCYCTWEKL